MCDPLLAEHLDQRHRVEITHDHARAALVHSRSCPTPTADVKQRHRYQVDRILRQLPDLLGHRDQPEEVVVTEHHSLRSAGGTAGIQLERDVIVGARDTRVVVGVRGHRCFVVGADHQNGRGRGEIRLDRIEHLHEVRSNDEHLGLGVVDDVLHLRPGEAPVHVDADRVQQRCAVEHLEVLDAVLVEKRDTVLIAHPGGGEQVGYPARALVQLGPRESPIPQHERGVIGTVYAVDADDVGDGFDRHGSGQ